MASENSECIPTDIQPNRVLLLKIYSGECGGINGSGGRRNLYRSRATAATDGTTRARISYRDKVEAPYPQLIRFHACNY